jgi:ribosome maturation factor RimP
MSDEWFRETDLEELKQRVQDLLQPEVKAEGYDLLDLVIKGHRNARVLQCFIGSEGEIQINACVSLSRRLSDLLEMHEESLDLGNYRLEVSSPGMDRPLQTEQDFRRKIGREISVRMQMNGEKKTIQGTLTGVGKGSLTIQEGNRSLEIDFSSIEEAKLRYPF